jgi:molecular chaperone HtpG
MSSTAPAPDTTPAPGPSTTSGPAPGPASGPSTTSGPAPVHDAYAFSADINQLLSLIVNTFYTEKDVFLRELVSNASDALDKAKFRGLTNHSELEVDPELRIEITADKAARTLTVFDSGVGMSRDDLVNDLGTIAKSGTKAFMEAATASPDLSMIGQFGVGFYSAFLVADKVRVSSRKSGEEQFVWESTAGGSFTVGQEDDGHSPIARGTRVILHLKEGLDEYLEETRIRDLVAKHTGFITFDIKLQVERTESKEVSDDGDADSDVDADADANANPDANADATPDATANADADADADTDADERPAKRTKTATETRTEFEVLNTQQPVWMRPASEVTHEEYATFYKALASDWEDHMAVSHFRVEGQLEFRGVVFVPSRAPFDMFSGGEEKKFNHIKVYARRVFIQENAKELMPDYLSFIHGVVDSDDLPLNISREGLQQTRILKVIRKSLVKKSLDAIEELAEDAEKYKKFYGAFARNLKLGIHDDQKNRARIAGLLRFQTSKSEEEQVSLKDYAGRMVEGQKALYYVIGESAQVVANSPFVERLRERGYEVLYMTDAIDEYAMQQLTEFDGMPLVCATEEGLTLPGDDEESDKETQKSFQEACDKVKEILGDRVDKVITSQRMENSPCCLVSGKYGYSANMQRILKAQALRDSTSMMMTPSKKIMELNPQHLLVRQLRDASDKDDKAHKTVCSDLSWMLFETALLTSGFTLDNPAAFADRVHRLVAHGLGLGGTPPGTRPSMTKEKEKEREVEVDGPAQAPVDGVHTMEEVD